MGTVVSLLLLRYLVIAAVVVALVLVALAVLRILRRRGAVDRARAAELARTGARWLDDGQSPGTRGTRRRVAGAALQRVARRFDDQP